jgi:hypothetical protein
MGHNSDGDNDEFETIICFLLVTPKYQECIEYIFNNWKFLKKIVGKHLDIVMVGYVGKEFQASDFVKFYKRIQNAINWRWCDKPQILILKMNITKGSMTIDTGKWTSVYINEAIKIGYVYSLAELLEKMVLLTKETGTKEEYIEKIARQLLIKKVAYKIVEKFDSMNFLDKSGSLFLQLHVEDR